MKMISVLGLKNMNNKKLANQNQHIDEYLNAYREMADVDFAVMITGPWGCGKTHFIKQYLDEHCTSGEEKEYLYISLNGVARTADIDMALFQAAHPVLGSKLAVTAGKIFKASLKAGLKVDLDINNDGAADGNVSVDPLAGLSLAKFKLSTKSKLLVFDDLERCLLKPEEVLGYINAFVESKEAKVLVIGDEKHFGTSGDTEADGSDTSIVPPDKSKYRMIKEKVIGKTYRLMERIEEIFDALVSDVAFPHTHELIVRNKDALIRMFQRVSEETGKYNYRALKHCFRDFEYFYPTLDENSHENESFLNDLLVKFIALDYELQVANYSDVELETGDTATIYAKAFREDDDKEDEATNLELVLKRHAFESNSMYPSMDTMILPLDLWGKILRNEWVDKSQITEAINNSSYFPDKQPEWVDLWYWRRSEDEDAVKALKEVREKIKCHAYTSYEIVMHVFSILLGLADEGAIKDSKEDIFSEALGYLNYLVERGIFKIPEKEPSWHWTNHSSHGLAYWAKKGDFNRLVTMIDDAIAKTVEKKRVELVDSWLEELQRFDGQFLTDVGTNGKYSIEPVLQYVDPSKFVGTLEEMPNSQKWLVGATIEKRYEHWSNKLVEELPFWEEVLSNLSEKFGAHTGLVTPSYKNLGQVKKNIELIIKVLREAAEQNRV